MDPGLVGDGDPIAEAHGIGNNARTADQLSRDGQLSTFERRNRDFFVSGERASGYSSTENTIQVPVGRSEP